MPDWLQAHRGQSPLIVSMPHTGTDIPPEIGGRLVSPWLGRKDADWHIEKLYDFAPQLDATIIRTTISRTVIDCNRDPSGASLYPGQATTGLSPTTTFDGEPLYRQGEMPDEIEIAQRRARYFDPYHAAIAGEIARLKARHGKVVLFDAHSIRSRIPRLFEGELPNFNIGTNGGRTCGDALTTAIEKICDATAFSQVTNGRFKGGWTTRHYGMPQDGLHAIQLELACRGYMDEPEDPAVGKWPSPYSIERAAPMRAVLKQILQACLTFAST
ncbi:MAG TPA: N-formylglutamate deformylase [Rhizomicrobium sp.]|jgi:formiminoglutamase